MHETDRHSSPANQNILVCGSNQSTRDYEVAQFRRHKDGVRRRPVAGRQPGPGVDRVSNSIELKDKVPCVSFAVI